MEFHERIRQWRKTDVGADSASAPPIYRPDKRADKSAVRSLNRCLRDSRPPFTLTLFLLLFLLTGCQFTQSPFVITVGNAGAEFAAASTTLTYVHTSKISTQYAQASFVNYQSQLSGLDQQLSSQQGASDKRTIEHLLALYRPAMQAVNSPCLAEGCNWQAQVTLLDRASQAFLKAGGQ